MFQRTLNEPRYISDLEPLPYRTLMTVCNLQRIQIVGAGVGWHFSATLGKLSHNFPITISWQQQLDGVGRNSGTEIFPPGTTGGGFFFR